ncbi:MAG: hypothetical protein WC456_00995 [Patescibacteria group bacterium]
MLEILRIDFQAKKPELMSIGIGWFQAIIGLPEHIRHDKKVRTGLRCEVGDMEADDRNFAVFSVLKPSEYALHFAPEKVTRMNLLGDFSSQNSAVEKKLRFPGAVAVMINKVKYSATTSGLYSEEDAFVSVMYLSCSLQLSPRAICQNIREHGGQLPDCFFDPSHYLYHAVNSESIDGCIPRHLVA